MFRGKLEIILSDVLNAFREIVGYLELLEILYCWEKREENVSSVLALIKNDGFFSMENCGIKILYSFL